MAKAARVWEVTIGPHWDEAGRITNVGMRSECVTARRKEIARQLTMRPTLPCQGRREQGASTEVHKGDTHSLETAGL